MKSASACPPRPPPGPGQGSRPWHAATISRSLRHVRDILAAECRRGHRAADRLHEDRHAVDKLDARGGTPLGALREKGVAVPLLGERLHAGVLLVPLLP